MKTTSNLLSIRQTATALRSGSITAQSLTQSLIKAIARLDDKIHSFVTVLEEEAMAAAARADNKFSAGCDAELLFGIPLAVKDVIDVRGVPTRCGSSTYPNVPASEDAQVVRLLREAGAILLGKTTTHELASGVQSPPASNPWDPSRIPGGSSGGSAAAVAAGLCLGALGSDTGGSVRIPASACGVAGLKPTFGLVPTTGVEPVSWSLDHVGPLARTVDDLSLILNVIAKSGRGTLKLIPDLSSDSALNIQGSIVGVPRYSKTNRMDPGVMEHFERACEVLASLGAHLVPVDIPDSKYLIAAEFGIVAPEMGFYHEQRLRTSGHQIHPRIRSLILAGLILPANHYLRALQARSTIAASVRQVFADHHLSVIVTPTLPAPAALKDQNHFEFDEQSEDVTIAYVRTTALFNLTGQPALTIPCGFSRDHLPIGLQIVGRPFEDGEVLRIGAAYEAVTNWHLRQPPIHSGVTLTSLQRGLNGES